MRYFTLEEILELHFMVIEDFGGSHGVRDEERLKSLAEAPQLVAFGKEQYGTVFEKAAVYMRNCSADHAFVDGNKRTATTLAGIFLMRNNYRLITTPQELEDFAVRVATKHMEIAEIAAWFEEYSDRLDVGAVS